MTRLRRLLPLARPLLRTAPLLPVPAVAALLWPALALGAAETQLGLAAVALAAAAAFALDDAARDVTAASPTPLRARVVVRLALLAPLLLLAWWAMARRAGLPAAGEQGREAAALALLAVGLAAAAARALDRPRPGLLAAVALFVAAGLRELLVPGKIPSAAVAALGALLLLLGTRDPAAVNRLRPLVRQARRHAFEEGEAMRHKRIVAALVTAAVVAAGVVAVAAAGEDTPTLAVYAERVDAICVEHSRRFESLPEAKEAAAVAELAPHAAAFADAYVGALRDVPLPEEGRADVEAWLAAQERLPVLLREVGDAAETGDQAEVDRRFEAVYALDTEPLADRIGLRTCPL